MSPHVDISSYCIKENTEESKQASVFQQVTRRRSHTQITKKRKGVGLGEWKPDIFTGRGGWGTLLTKSDPGSWIFFSATGDSWGH